QLFNPCRCLTVVNDDRMTAEDNETVRRALAPRRFPNLADQIRRGAFGGTARIQLHPWLVPHSVQTPQAPARITLSLPHTEQVISIKMLPSATMTRSAWPLPFPPCPAVVESLVGWFVITSITSFSPVRAKSVTGRFKAFFSISTISLSGKSGCARFGAVASL